MGGVTKYFAILGISMLALVACGGSAEEAKSAESMIKAETIEATGDATQAEYIVVSKESMCLKVYDVDNRLVCRFSVALGSAEGDKCEVGDMRTPEGEFAIERIEDASQWLYDNGDGAVEGFYGNWFIRLNTEFKGIGIYGTGDNEIIGRRSTEGSVRLANADLDSLRPMLREGMRVRIDASDVSIAEARAVISEGETARESETESAVLAVAEAAQKETVEMSPQGEEVWHTVADGELLGRIVRSYGTTIAEVKRLNPDLNVDRLSIGQRILISRGAVPQSIAKATESAEPKSESVATTEGDQGEVWHTLAKGEFVGRVAQRYGTTSKRIAELNPDINIDRVREGQRIRVK